jgi:hypothetical protein
MKKSLILVLSVLAMVSILAAPVYAAILFEDDFSVNGPIDSSKWFFVTDYAAQGGLATPSDVGGKMYSTDSFGGLGSGQITVEFLGVKLKQYVEPATQYSDNWFGMFDLGSNWFATGTGFMIDWAADLAACPNRQNLGITWTPFQLDTAKSYDMRIVYTPGGNIDMYCNEAGASTWNLVCNGPTAPTQALKIEVYADNGYYFDKIIVSTPTVPEPSSILALFSGLVGIIGVYGLKKH